MSSVNFISQTLIFLSIVLLLLMAIYFWKISPDLFEYMTHAFCV